MPSTIHLPSPSIPVAEQAVDNVLATLDLTPDEKLTLAHRLLADVAQSRAGTDAGRRLQIFVLQLRMEIGRQLRRPFWREA